MPGEEDVPGEEGVDKTVDMESTQAYNINTLLNEQTDFKDGGSMVMECDPTLAYGNSLTDSLPEYFSSKP